MSGDRRRAIAANGPIAVRANGNAARVANRFAPEPPVVQVNVSSWHPGPLHWAAPPASGLGPGIVQQLHDRLRSEHLRRRT